MKSVVSVSFASSVCILSVLILLGLFLTCLSPSLRCRDLVFRFTVIESAPQEAPESPFDSQTAGWRGAGAETRNQAVFASNRSIRIESLMTGSPEREVSPPDNYTELAFSGCDYPVYGFINPEGRLEYRILLERTENGVPVKGYVEAQPVLSGTSIRFKPDETASFIPADEENFGILSPADAPVESAAGLTRCWGADGLYFRTGSDGIRQYFIYGAYPGGTPGFVPADPDGHMIPGKLPVAYTAEEEVHVE